MRVPGFENQTRAGDYAGRVYHKKDFPIKIDSLARFIRTFDQNGTFFDSIHFFMQQNIFSADHCASATESISKAHPNYRQNPAEKFPRAFLSPTKLTSADVIS